MHCWYIPLSFKGTSLPAQNIGTIHKSEIIVFVMISGHASHINGPCLLSWVLNNTSHRRRLVPTENIICVIKRCLFAAIYKGHSRWKSTISYFTVHLCKLTSPFRTTCLFAVLIFEGFFRGFQLFSRKNICMKIFSFFKNLAQICFFEYVFPVI